MKRSLALVGCGAMGSALLKGWLSLPNTQESFTHFWIITPHSEHVKPFLTDSRVQWFSSSNDLTEVPDVIVFAVKPFILEEILPHYKDFNSLFVTVASGKSLAFYERHLSPTLPIIRAMPNIPVSIHQGVTGLFTKTDLSPHHMTLLKACFLDLGFCVWVNSDDDIDKMTALSGSGPAYVYFMIESLAKIAESLGFEKKTAMSIALNTFRGATNYAQASHENPTVLRQRVTSPKGTTIEALNVFETRGLYTILEDGVKAAYKRAREIAE